MKVLIACEESQAVCIEFRKLGVEAFSCDLQECSGGFPEWHIQGDAIEQLYSGKYKMAICFPPCTHLAVSGAAWFEQKIKDGRQQEGIDFFMKVVKAPVEMMATENPVGIMSRVYRKPDQIIQPYYFGDKSRKTTCLWLKNLPKLFHAKSIDLFNNNITHVEPELYIDSVGRSYSKDFIFDDNGKWMPFRGQSKRRSKTFPGIAKSMAEQWSPLLK